jgi:HEAT repeat protein
MSRLDKDRLASLATGPRPASTAAVQGNGPTRWQLAIVILTATVLAADRHSQAYFVGSALPLDKLVEEADVIVKAEVLASRPVDNEPWFDKYPGLSGWASELKVISVVKGSLPAGTITFQHYGHAEGGPRAVMFMPQYYDLETGNAYLIFAKKTDRPAVLRQLWKDHRTKEDQGVFRTADARPVDALPVAQVVWTELCKLLASSDTDDAVYAIRQLNEMSGGPRWPELHDFERAKALAAIAPLLAHKDDKVVLEAITAVGAASPYLRDEDALFWLATVGGGYIPAISKRDPAQKNEGGKTYWKELVRIGDGDRSFKVRTLAIRALGRAGQPEVEAAVGRWTDDLEPSVRRPAAFLLADFPGERSEARLRKLARDDFSAVRAGAARAIGFGQFNGLLDVLDGLLDGQTDEVRAAAALSLLSFAPARSERILKKHLDDPDFRSVFVNALAQANPQPYLDELADIITRRLQPRRFWGGRVPYADSWDILFKYVRDQDLTQMGKYLDALENAKFWSSSEPRDLYALYVKSGMDRRARAFREACKESISFDMETYFNDVDREAGIPVQSLPAQ